MMTKVLIIGSSKLPTPAVLGGAVPNLIEEWIAQQEIEQKLNLTCCSLWHPQAQKDAEQYTHTQFIWAKKPKIIQWADTASYFLFKKLFHVERLLSISFIFQVAWFTFFIACLLHRENYDFVIFENSVPLLAALKLLGNRKKYQDKYFIHMHSVPRHYYGNATLFANSRRVICVSDYVAHAILHDNRLPSSLVKTTVLYNCINTDLFNPKPPLISLPKNLEMKNGPKVLFVGRLCKDKGIEEILKAFVQLKNKQTQLWVVGSNFYKSDIVSPYEQTLRRLAEPLQGRIHFTGYIDYNQMPAIYHQADVVALPSMWEEPAGMTILEAMACQKPVITTSSGGIPEYTGEDTCILLKRDEHIVDHLANAIDQLLENSTLANSLAQKSSQRAAQFSRVFYYQQLLTLLRSIK